VTVSHLVPVRPLAPPVPGSADLAALGATLARAQAEGAAVTVVYAPTSVTHHHAASPVVVPVPVAQPYRGAAGHPGIDIDLTGFGGAFVVPADPGPMPTVAERREFAPLVLLASTWSGLGALVVAVVTGYRFAIAYTVVASIVTLLAYVVNHRNMWGR
jgi:hypothetical protein